MNTQPPPTVSLEINEHGIKITENEKVINIFCMNIIKIWRTSVVLDKTYEHLIYNLKKTMDMVY